MNLYTSKYLKIDYDESNLLIINTFNKNTVDMNVDEFKEERIIFLNYCLKYKPKYILINNLELIFPIAPELQQWVNLEIFSKIRNFVNRIAFLMPSDFITNLSVEQTLDEKEGSTFNKRFFDTEQEALKWLLK